MGASLFKMAILEMGKDVHVPLRCLPYSSTLHSWVVYQVYVENIHGTHTYMYNIIE